MKKSAACITFFSVCLFAASFLLARQGQRGGAQSPQGDQTGAAAAAAGNGRIESGAPSQARMTFFVTSVGLGKGGDLGGLAGADAHCQRLAAAAGAGNHTWHAYLSTQARPGQPGVNARDRIGTGPWYNWSYAERGAPQNAMISRDLGDLHGDTLIQAQRGNNLFKQWTVNEKGQVIHGVGDPPPIQHEILTGSKWDGRAYTDGADHTCNNWTSSSTGSARVGHSDRIGHGSSWNSSNDTKGCSQSDLESGGGTGLFYCFAIN